MFRQRIVAIVRPPTEALARCELTHLDREPLDVGLARTQHDRYATLLRQLGADVIVLPPEEALPDAVFVEDVALVLDELAILTNPGVESRRAEVSGVATALEPYRQLVWIRPPATLDGGDVIVAERTLYVGRSSRTNEAGIEQLRRLVDPSGYDVRAVDVGRCLHLKSAATRPADGVYLLNPVWVDASAFHDGTVLRVPEHEPRGANTFRVGDSVVLAANFPATRSLLERHGLDVRTVDLSELQKAEAGGSCMSLVFPERP